MSMREYEKKKKDARTNSVIYQAIYMHTGHTWTHTHTCLDIDVNAHANTYCRKTKGDTWNRESLKRSQV